MKPFEPARPSTARAERRRLCSALGAGEYVNPAHHILGVYARDIFRNPGVDYYTLAEGRNVTRWCRIDQKCGLVRGYFVIARSTGRRGRGWIDAIVDDIDVPRPPTTLDAFAVDYIGSASALDLNGVAEGFIRTLRTYGVAHRAAECDTTALMAVADVAEAVKYAFPVRTP